MDRGVASVGERAAVSSAASPSSAPSSAPPAPSALLRFASSQARAAAAQLASVEMQLLDPEQRAAREAKLRQEASRNLEAALVTASDPAEAAAAALAAAVNGELAAGYP